MAHGDEVGSPRRLPVPMQHRRLVGLAAAAVAGGWRPPWWSVGPAFPDWRRPGTACSARPRSGPYVVVAATAAGRRLTPVALRILVGMLGAIGLLGIPLVANAPYREPYSGFSAVLLIGLQWAVAAAGLVGVIMLRRATAEPGAAPNRGRSGD